MDARKHFNISDFLNFVEYIDSNRRVNSLSLDSRYDYYDTALIAEGFKSAQYHDEYHKDGLTTISWSMTEEEFTWFVLKWS